MKSNGTPGRLRLLVRGTASAVIGMTLIVGVPWCLAVVIGWPLPHHVPSLGGLRTSLSTRGIPDRALIDVLDCVAWLAWASIVVSIFGEVVAALGGRRSQQLFLVRTFQPVAGRLVTSVLFAVLVFGRTDPSPATSIHPPLAQVLGDRAALISEVLPTLSVPSQNEETQNMVSTVVTSDSYTVVPNDTLWSIAGSQLGDPTDWPAIAALNLGRTMDDGRHFVDPNLIYPGWVLQLPPS